jgi:hypothetical protein
MAQYYGNSRNTGCFVVINFCTVTIFFLVQKTGCFKLQRFSKKSIEAIDAKRQKLFS